MLEINHQIKDELGMHARPAGLFVKLCAGFASDIQIRRGEKTVSAKKIFGVMGLGAKCGDDITVTIAGEDEEAAHKAISEFLGENL